MLTYIGFTKNQKLKLVGKTRLINLVKIFHLP